MPTTLFSEVPANIADLRRRLFSLEEPVELPRAEWDLVWPYVDNIWIKNKDRAGADGRRTVYYLCRRHSTKTWTPKEKDGGRQRQRLAREAIGCDMRFKAVFTAASVIATRTNECESHCHDLELLDFQKKNSGVMALAAKEAFKGYKISHVAANVTARHRPEQRTALKDVGGHWVTLLDIHNSATAYKSANPDVRRVGTRKPWEEQLSAAFEWFEGQEKGEKGAWKFRRVTATRFTDGETFDGLVFGHRERLRVLAKRGYLTLMDATHCTNEMRWLLYTLMVRNEQGNWIPGAHILTAKEDSDVFKLGVKQIKRWCQNSWNLRYIFTDNSAGEQRATSAAFFGLSAGEQQVTHLFCRKHSDATILRKFPGRTLLPVATALRSALYNRRTRMGCEQSVAEVIAAAPTADLKQYIRKEWQATEPDWVNYARCHSSILLQVLTTNPVEGWHSALKHGVKQEMLTWSLRGIVEHVANISLKYDKRAEKDRRNWKQGHYADSVQYPGLEKLPGPIQLFIFREREEGLVLIQEGADPREFDSEETFCDCLFFRQYQLPCRHLFQVDILTGKVFREEDWAEWNLRFEDSGFEVYEGFESYRREDSDRDEEAAPAQRRLEVREVCDSLLQRYYAMENALAGWDEPKRAQFFKRWIGQLETMAGEVRQAGVEALAEEKGLGVEALAGTESQQKKRGLRAITKKQWLQKKALEWDLREAQRAQEAEDSQLRKGQWRPPKGSRKRQRRDPKAGKFLSFDEDSEGWADAPWEHDEPIVIN